MAEAWLKHLPPTPLLTSASSARPPRFLLLVITAAALSASTTPSELTAAKAARCPDQYMHVRTIVVRAYTARTGYTFLNLDYARPSCPLVVKPELATQLSTAPSKLTGCAVMVQNYVQATSGSTAQIWLDRTPALSVAP